MATVGFLKVGMAIEVLDPAWSANGRLNADVRAVAYDGVLGGGNDDDGRDWFGDRRN